MASISLEATKNLLDQTEKLFSFEIFGLDYMIDQNFHPWLIEINTNPCLELSSPLLARIIPSMLDNAFRISIDPIFMPSSFSHTQKIPH
jgi:tubulin polyglutamylase TTLL1